MNRRLPVTPHGFIKALALFGFILCYPLAAYVSAEDGGNASLNLGYRAYSTHDNAGRAVEYGYHHSSPYGEIEATGGGETNHIIFEGVYENENDYYGDLHLDSGGTLLLDLRTERFFHNLDHIPYNSVPEARPDAYVERPDPTPDLLRASYDDQDPADEYGLRINIDEARFRGKIKTYPAHLNLGYWRMERKGAKQLRFVDDRCAASCHFQSKTRDIDRVTEEFAAGVDAHVGFFDVVVEQVYRVFRDNEEIPRDDFKFFTAGALTEREHSEDPDSKYAATTLKAHTSLSGGVVGAASVTVGERENRSDLTSVSPIKAETDFYKAAGDLTLLPSKHWTVNFRYRLLDMDTSNSKELSGDLYYSPLLVRESIDLTRGEYAASVSYRPKSTLTLKADYQRQEIHRGDTGGPEEYHSNFNPNPPGGPPSYDLVWELPEDEVIDRYRLGFLARPLGNRYLKVNGWYQYQHSDDPAYGTSFKDGHEAFLNTTYSHSSNRWGLSGTLKAKDESNNKFEIVQFDGTGAEVSYELDRELQQQNVTVGLWFIPVDGVNAGLNYGYMRSRILQDLFFGNDPDDYNLVDKDVEYSQAVQTISAHINWQMTESLECRLEGIHVKSFGEYKPYFVDDFPTNPYTGPDISSFGLRELTQVDLRQNGFKFSLNGDVARNLGWSAGYTYDDYDDKNSNVFDGSVQTVLASLSLSW